MAITEDSNSGEKIATLIGITSWGAACGYAEYPDVFARVTHVLDWINEETGNHYNLFSCNLSFFKLIENKNM